MEYTESIDLIADKLGQLQKGTLEVFSDDGLIEKLISAVNTNGELQAQALQEILLVKRLVSVLIGGGKLHEIGGYTHGKTKEGEGDPYIILYSAAQGMVHKVVRVYEHDFGKLPHYVSTEFPTGVEYIWDNPTKTQAKKKGIYRNCRTFTVATYEGKQTQMGPEVRFHSVIYEWEQGQAIVQPFKIPYAPVEQPPQEPEEEAQEPEVVDTEETDQEIVERVEEEERKETAEEEEPQKVTAPDWDATFEEGANKVRRVVDDLMDGRAENVTRPTTQTALWYGNKERVPENQATYKIFSAFVAAKGVVPKDGDELKEFYNATENGGQDA